MIKGPPSTTNPGPGRFGGGGFPGRTFNSPLFAERTQIRTALAVKKALIDAGKGNPKIEIEPSDTFNTTVKELEKAEQRFLGKKTTIFSKKKIKAKK